MQHFGYSVFVLAVLTTTVAGADGGGSGRPRSPYSKEPTVDEVRDQKQKANASRWLTATTKKGYFFAGGLCFTRNKACAGDVIHAIEGRTANGQPLVVNFSDAKTLQIGRVLDAGTSKARVEVTIVVFPDITAERLVVERPSFSHLPPERSVTGYVPLSRREGEELWFTEPTARANGESVLAARFSDFAGTPPLEFDTERESLWWAVPSVIADPRYPYRIVTAN